MKIFVTGSSGYIGSHLCDLLKKNGHTVYGQDLNDPLIPIDSFLKQDIRDGIYEDPRFDVVIHLAALVRVSESESNPIEYYSTNIDGTAMLLNQIKCTNFIFASTGTAESCNSVYARSKRVAEDYVKNFCQDFSIPYTIFRFYNVIGSTIAPVTNTDGLFYNLQQAAKTKSFTLYGTEYPTRDGSAVRDYVHVEEICQAILKACNSPSNSTENLGNGIGYTVKEIINIFKRVNNVEFDVVNAAPRKGDLVETVLKNPSEFMKKLYTIEEMLRIKL